MMAATPGSRVKTLLKARPLALPLTLCDYVINGYLKPRPNLTCDRREQELFDELEANGHAVVHDYMSPSKCAELRGQIDRWLDEHKDYVHRDPLGSDLRVWGVETISPDVNRFAKDEMLLRVGGSYMGAAVRTGFTLANRVTFVEGNKGSGGGWHRDEFVREYKVILYLSDVSEDNGPFQFVSRSHRLGQMVRDIRVGKLRGRQNRISETEVDAIVQNDRGRIINFTGPAGTAIIADTSAIHRGMPIRAGVRYALTNYYWAVNGTDEQALYDLYSPVLRGHDPQPSLSAP